MNPYLLGGAAAIGIVAATFVAHLIADRKELRLKLDETRALVVAAQNLVAAERIATAEAQRERDRIAKETEGRYRPVLDELMKRNNTDEIDPASDIGLVVCSLYPGTCGGSGTGPR